MPSGDRTGPNGMGPMTGRRAGFCAGFSTPGYMNPYGGGGAFRRAHRGGGRGYGRGFGFAAPVQPYGYPSYNWAESVPYGYSDPEAAAAQPGQEIEVLKDQAAHLELTLKNLKKHIKDLGTGASEEA